MYSADAEAAWCPPPRLQASCSGSPRASRDRAAVRPGPLQCHAVAQPPTPPRAALPCAAMLGEDAPQARVGTRQPVHVDQCCHHHRMLIQRRVGQRRRPPHAGWLRSGRWKTRCTRLVYRNQCCCNRSDRMSAAALKKFRRFMASGSWRGGVAPYGRWRGHAPALTGVGGGGWRAWQIQRRIATFDVIQVGRARQVAVGGFSECGDEHFRCAWGHPAASPCV